VRRLNDGKRSLEVRVAEETTELVADVVEQR
jgi:hypothetical protein